MMAAVRRRLFTSFSALSLMLFLGSVTLVWRGRMLRDEISVQVGDSLWVGRSDREGLYLRRQSQTYQDRTFLLSSDPPKEGYDAKPNLLDASTTHVDRLGILFLAGDSYGPGPRPYWMAGVAPWLVPLCTAPLPLWWAAAKRRERKRVRHGHCPACDYDLRASPGCCPECGRGSN
ncbi:MAG: hypothetical protein JWM97_6 [Phycisphaerales bacterium]|jgi:hypothetical protein|nr:hypothetical protein [Phycisphaerales bacterium]